MMKQSFVPGKYEHVIYQMLPDSEFSTGFIEGQCHKRQQFHWYSRLIKNVAHKLLCNRIVRHINEHNKILLYTQARSHRRKKNIFSCTLSLTSARDWLGDQNHTSVALLPGKIWYWLHRRLGGTKR